MGSSAGIGSLGVKLSLDAGEFEGGLSKAGAAAEREMARIERSNKKAAAEADRYIASLQRQVATHGLAGTALQRYEAALKGASDKAAPLLDQLDKLKAAQDAQKAAAAAAAAAQAEAGKHMEHFGFQTVAAKRELVVLAHEMSQGNYSKFGGSVMVLAERMNLMEVAFSTAGRTVLGIVGVIALFAVAAAKGAIEADKFGKSLALTGNYAGITAGQLDTMSKAIAEGTSSHIATARAAIEGLVATGDIGPRALAPMATAITALQKLTGEDTEKIVADFAKLTEAPAKWAAEHNRAFNFLSAAQYEYIKRLEEQGKKEEAAAYTTKLLADALGSRMPQSLGYLQQALATTAHWWDVFWNAAKSAGAPETIENQIGGLQRKLAANAEQRQAGSLGFRPTTVDRQSDADIKAQLNALEAARDQQGQAAAINAYTAAKHKAGVESAQYLDKINKEARATNNLKTAMAELHRQQDAYRADGGVLTAAQVAEQEAEVRKRNTPHVGAGRKGPDLAKQLDTRFEERQRALSDEGLKLDHEIASFEKYGRAIGTARTQILDLEIAQGKLKGLDPSRIKTLRDLAAADDAKDKALDVAKLNADLDKRVAKLQAAATAHAMTSREVRIANELTDAEGRGLEKGSAAWEKYAAKIRQAVNAEEDQALKRKLASERLTNDAEIAKLNEELRLIGMTTLERQKAVVALRLQAEAQKDIKENPGSVATILDEMVQKRDRLTAAIERNYTATRSFDAGARTAFTKYREDSENAAAFADRVITGGIKHMEDALVNFAHTGRLNFGSLFQFMADEFLRQQARMVVAAATNKASGLNFGGGIGGFIDSIGSMFRYGGSSTDPTAPNYENSLDRGFKLAAGTNFVPYDGMPAVLHKGEAVVPAAYNPAAGGKGGGNVSVVVENHGAAPATTQETRGANGERQIRVLIEAAKSAVASDIRQGGDVHSALAGVYGLNRAAGVPRGP